MWMLSSILGHVIILKTSLGAERASVKQGGFIGKELRPQTVTPNYSSGIISSLEDCVNVIELLLLC